VGADLEGQEKRSMNETNGEEEKRAGRITVSRGQESVIKGQICLQIVCKREEEVEEQQTDERSTIGEEREKNVKAHFTGKWPGDLDSGGGKKQGRRGTQNQGCENKVTRGLVQMGPQSDFQLI